METYSRNNESTDSFLSVQAATVLSLRQENPNLQTIDEKAVNRLDSIHRTKRHNSLTKRPSSSRYSLAATSQLTRSSTQETNDIDKLTKNLQVQNFWKYHIISVGKNEMYLTTNPDIKHLYCRNGPGYFVHLVLPKVSSKGSQNRRQSDIGFRLIFKRQIYDEVDNEDNLKDPCECIVVTKAGKEDGGFFSIILLMLNDLNSTVKEKPMTVKCKAMEQQIEELIELLENDPRNEDLRRIIPSFHRYQVNLDDDQSWLVGSNPVAKQKTSNRLKINHDMFKLTGKQNVYFYRKGGNVIKPQQVSKRLSFIKSFKSETRSVQYDDRILALFRPHERRFKKKMIKTLSTTGSLKPLPTTVEEYNYIENNQYYKPGDGLNQLNPKDDAPNENKIGWLTIFEDEASIDMWEIVLGYTFAVGFDRIIDEYVAEQE